MPTFILFTFDFQGLIRFCPGNETQWILKNFFVFSSNKKQKKNGLLMLQLIPEIITQKMA